MTDRYFGIQTFYVDKTSVGNATQTSITSVNLYCKSKPTIAMSIAGSNLNTISSSGVVKPGVSVYIVPVVNDKPAFTDLSNYMMARRLYDDIQTSGNATTATKFTFSNPVVVDTDKFYAIVIAHDFSSNYTWWGAKSGEVLVGTNTVSPGAGGSFLGKYFNYTTSLSTATPINNYSLKFNIYCAKYASNGSSYSNNSIQIRNRHVEFIEFDEINSDLDFSGQEYVYQEKDLANGTVLLVNNSVTIVGNGTNFSSLYTTGGDEEYVVFCSGANRYLRQIISVTSNTVMKVDSPLPVNNSAATFYKTPIAVLQTIKNSHKDGSKSKLAVLVGSTANSSLKFTSNNRIYGELSGSYLSNVSVVDIPLNGIASMINFQMPSGSSVTGTLTTNYTKDGGNNTIVDPSPFTKSVGLWKSYDFTKDDNAVVPSWSNEIDLIGGSVSSTDNSNAIVINLTTNLGNDFNAPTFVNDGSVLFYYRYFINNDYTNENTKYGNAYSKHITTKVTLKENSFAEDMLVYLDAIKPLGTDIKTFVKFYHSEDSEAFDDKEWTLLENKESTDLLFSSNSSHKIELVYGLRQFPNSQFTLSGRSQTTLDSVNVIGSGTTYSSNLQSGDLIKIYPSLFPNNYVIGVVNTVTNNTFFNLKQPITNNSIVGSGMQIDKIEYKYQAFSNKNNDNVVRYYNTNMIEFDNFNSFAIKLVFVSNSQFEIPKVINIRAVPVSA